MTFFTGFLVGIASLIPGISGGTILVITNQYNRIAQAISNYKNKENLLTLLFLLLGILLGTVTFARIIEFLFKVIPNGIMIIFSSFILFNLPKMIKNENIKIKWPWFIVGIIIIFILSLGAPNVDKVVVDYPQITLIFLIIFGLCGAMDGFFTIIPGISGSMMMMLLGPYYLYKSYLANLSIKTIYFLIPLFFYLIGDLWGFYLGSKFSLYFIKKAPQTFFSIIFGMVLASAILILPIPTLTLANSLQYLFFISIGFIFYKVLQKFM